jgi:N-methylhydantoinase B/oxoprolinase/acetone carboxylase alpha subunit
VAANIAHIAEIGGKAAGSFAADATEVFQEGLRLPPVKLVSEGKLVQDVWRIILANHRTPRNTFGDFHAMMASLAIAERRIQRLIGKYGLEVFETATEELIAYAERWMRTQIRKLPRGEYEFVDCMEDDGITDRPVYIRVRVAIEDDEVIVDYTETDPQTAGPVNATYVVTMGASFTAILQALQARDVPLNAGAFRPITVIAPPGSLVNVEYPGASVGGGTETVPRITETVQGALAQAIPDRVAAADGGTLCNFLCGGTHPETGEYFTHYFLEGVGWGGRPDKDGNSVQLHPTGNLCQNTPNEVIETRLPWRVKEYSMRCDSGGAGLHRGGLGMKRVLEVTADEITVSALFDRAKVHPWGLHGGRPGAKAAIVVRRSGEAEFRTFSDAFGTKSPSKFTNVVLCRGDEVMILSSGGGGWGDPLTRDPERVLEDVRDRYVSVERALEDYGVAIDVDGRECSIDQERTTTARERARRG